MLDVDIKIDNLKGLETYVKYVDKLLSMKDDRHFKNIFKRNFYRLLIELQIKELDLTQLKI